MDKIRVGYASDAVGTAPVWTACDEGYFKKLGLEVEPVLIRGSAAVTRAIEAGEVQLANFAAPAMVQANVERNADLILVLATMNRVMQALSGRPGVTKIEQLRGGSIGINAKGEVNEWILEAVLPRVGLTPHKDVKIVEIGRHPGKEWHTKAKVDALVLHPPQPFEAAKDGWTTLLDTRSLNMPFQLSCITGRRDWIENNRALVQRYLEGHVEGIHRFNTDLACGIRVQKKWGPTQDEDICIETHKFASGEFSPDPHPSEVSIRNILVAMKGSIAKADPNRAKDYMDGSFIAEMEKSGKLGALHQKYGIG
jgi:ABC-type nitrate/sulfonate/bicarbonate transport system substrate-binding protein